MAVTICLPLFIFLILVTGLDALLTNSSGAGSRYIARIKTKNYSILTSSTSSSRAFRLRNSRKKNVLVDGNVNVSLIPHVTLRLRRNGSRLRFKKQMFPPSNFSNSNSNSETLLSSEFARAATIQSAMEADHPQVASDSRAHYQSNQRLAYSKPRVESVYMVDNNFALADPPDNNFHIWRAPFYTFGQPWPLPQKWRPTRMLLTLDAIKFSFKCNRANSVVVAAFQRYRRLLFETHSATYYSWPQNKDRLALRVKGSLAGLNVLLKKQGGAWPHMAMDESYSLRIGFHGQYAVLRANETWGVLRGLETFSQLVWQTEDGVMFINRTTIEDRPRFAHRGLLVDTARHFVRKETLLRNLDAMAYNKLNVFHWHLIDDQSFPFQSRTFPNLSRFGAFDHHHSVYTYTDVKEIVEEARLRGIRVIPELDSPGHTHGLSYAFPHVMTRCFDENGAWNGYFGPVNPAVPALFDLLEGLFKEIIQLFPDRFIHLGADEVPLKCWESNPLVQRLMAKFQLDRVDLVTDYYMRKLQNIITKMSFGNKSKRRSFVVWQEAHDNGLLLKEGTIVQVWKGDGVWELHQVARSGRRVIYSACWYLDRLEYGPQWIKFYECEPGPSYYEQHVDWHDNIIGGEACMWMEYQSDNTVLSRIWPLTSAMAERLWSPMGLLSTERAAPRLEEQRCRLIQRGITAGVASGPGSCPHHTLSSLPINHNYGRQVAAVLSKHPVRQPLQSIVHSAAPLHMSSIYSFETFVFLLLLTLTVCVLLFYVRKCHTGSLHECSLFMIRWFSTRRLLILLFVLVQIYIVALLAPFVISLIYST